MRIVLMPPDRRRADTAGQASVRYSTPATRAQLARRAGTKLRGNLLAVIDDDLIKKTGTARPSRSACSVRVGRRMLRVP
jgi:hypothetical protein